MKNYIYLLLCILLFSCGQTQNNETKVDADTNSVDSVSVSSDSVKAQPNPTSVPEIKQAFSLINKKLEQGVLDSVSFKYDCKGERNGTVTYFSEKGKLAVIKHSYNEYSHFSAVDQYFVNDGSLFFAHFNRVVWSFASGQAAEGATKDDITEQRIYIAAEKPLLCLEKKYTINSHSSDNPIPGNLSNKEVECKTTASVLRGFGKLLAFKDSANRDCLAIK
ncbi:hypothetical protein [Pedobacter psychroterrae]|uniref:Lipoprotein n=1 Tax=Pedobacter psychroterrae TaxID=2530453 RepID=A0A4V2ML98_9SPHI|nr:hypothetical protein [Pedobacter psychroterrae]TCD01197.1 hypothetical protein EZ437_10570 [Pedobacter psychroterrae]